MELKLLMKELHVKVLKMASLIKKSTKKKKSKEREESSTSEIKDSKANILADIPSRQREFEGYVQDRRGDDELNDIVMRPRTSGSEGDSSFTKADGQEFISGSHNSMVTLENRVQGLERVFEEMSHDLSVASDWRFGGFRSRYEGSSSQPIRDNGYGDYGGIFPYGKRFNNPEEDSPSMRLRGPPRRTDHQQPWGFNSYGAAKIGQPGVRVDVSSNGVDSTSPSSEHECDSVSVRRGSDKVSAHVRLGESGSAISVRQASEDEATLAAIRVAGEDNGTTRTARVAVRKLDAEALANGNNRKELDPIRTAWRNSMDAVQAGNMDTAYAEVLSTGDDSLLVKLMDRSGPVFDQLTDKVAVKTLIAIIPFGLQQRLCDLCLTWVQQLLDLVLENGTDVFGIPINVKKELLSNLYDATFALEIPEDWEISTPDQLMLQLASAWNIDLQKPGS